MQRMGLLLIIIASCSSPTGVANDTLFAPEVPTGPVSTVQEELAESEFLGLVSDDTDLESLREKITSDGYTTFITAGKIEDADGARLIFAAYSDAQGDIRTLLRYCIQTDCTAALARLDKGEVEWSDINGNAIPVRQITVPYLLRELTVTGDKTSLVAPLTQPVDPTSIDLTRRRLLVVNQFGSAFGLRGEELVQELAKGGLFTDVTVFDYANASDLTKAVVSSYPHEILVVISQPVRQLFKQSVSTGQPNWYKTVGLEMSQGIYGFSMIRSESIASIFRSAPLSGPGLVLLVGSESLGDGTDGMYKAPASMMQQLNISGKVVAGFIGSAPPAILLDVTKTFLFELAMGRTAKEAKDQANAYLEAYLSKARMAFTDDSDEDYRLLPPSHNFYEGPAPKSADFAPYFHFRLYCASGPGKPEKAIEEKQANPLFRDLTVEGPIFRGEMEMEISPEKTLKAKVLGVLGELRKGAHFYFVFEGDAKEGYEGLTLYGNAEIIDIKASENLTTLEFTGSAEALPFTDQHGQWCTLHDTDLEPMVAGQGVSKLILKY